MDDKRDPNVYFAFDHKIFTVEGAYFSLTHDTKEPCYFVDLGEMKGAIPTKALCQEFGIDQDSSDAKLLATIGRALKYVREIRPNDCIPKELLDGSASWTIDNAHKEIARGRMTVQVISWLKGDEEIVFNALALEKISNDPETKEKIQTAFREIAEELGVQREDVIAKIDEVVRELAYIEALRDHCAKIKKINSNLGRLADIYRRDRSISEDISRMLVLLEPVLRRFDREFIDIDAQTFDVMVMLRNFQMTIDNIRRTRDVLHQNFMVWHDMLKKWDGKIVEESQEIERLLRETYRFLARNYMQSQSWRLGGT